MRGRGLQADPGTMAKLVECVPNFSEGNNKEVRGCVEGLRGGRCWGVDSWAAQAAPTARPCLAPSEVLSTFPCLADAENAPRQPLLPFASWREVQAQTNPLPTAGRLPRVVWNIPLEIKLLAVVVPNHVTHVNRTCAGHQP